VNPITYYGTGATDAKPKPRQAPDFDRFVNQILALPRARSKETRRYICGPLKINGDGTTHRCKADVLPRRWLAEDLDGGDRDEVEILLMRLTDYRAVAWQTARSTIECPRWRILICLDREVDRLEGVRLGDAFIGVVGDGLPSLKWDISTHRGEQAAYLPMEGATVTQYHGAPVAVDAMLALWKEPPKNGAKRARADGSVLEGARNAHLTSLGGTLRRKGMSEAGIRAALLVENGERCTPRLSDEEVGKIAASVSRYEPAAREEPPVEAYEEDARQYAEEPGKGNGGNGATPPPSADKGNGTGAGEAKRGPRSIVVLAGKLPQTLDEAESALLSRGGVYQRGSLLVRVVTIPESRVTRSVRRHKGALVILPFDKTFLVESLTSAARWEMFNPKIEKFCTINCPKAIAEGLLSRVGAWRFPVLAGIAEAPYMIDGHIYAAPCYEPRTGVYLNPGHNEFPEIPKNPLGRKPKRHCRS
jgi:hypothetical protein